MEQYFLNAEERKEGKEGRRKEGREEGRKEESKEGNCQPNSETFNSALSFIVIYQIFCCGVHRSQPYRS